MTEDLTYLMRKCRDSAPYLTEEQVLAKCRTAARQEGQARIRTTSYVRRKMKEPTEGGRNIGWSDIRSVAMSATGATWQEDHGRWKLTGGLDNDGEPLTAVFIVVLDNDDVYVWNAFAPYET